jgi:RecA/RadA recombinase
VGEKKISGKKIKDIVGRESFPTINNSLILYSPTDFDEQHDLIQRLEFFILNQKIGMIVVDTITNLYRQNLVIGRNDKQKYERLAFQVAFLHKLTREKKIPVIIFNQATIQKAATEKNKQTLEQERVSPVARAIMNYWADRHIILINRGFGKFEARIASHFDKKVRFNISKEGIGKTSD